MYIYIYIYVYPQIEVLKTDRSILRIVRVAKHVGSRLPCCTVLPSSLSRSIICAALVLHCRCVVCPPPTPSPYVPATLCCSSREN